MDRCVHRRASHRNHFRAPSGACLAPALTLASLADEFWGESPHGMAILAELYDKPFDPSTANPHSLFKERFANGCATTTATAGALGHGDPRRHSSCLLRQ